MRFIAPQAVADESYFLNQMEFRTIFDTSDFCGYKYSQLQFLLLSSKNFYLNRDLYKYP